MSGISIVLDLLRKNPSFYSAQTLHSHGVLTATVAASAAAASVAASAPFASRFLFSTRIPTAYCDAGVAVLLEDDITDVQKTFHIENIPYGALKYSSKEYRIDLKPLFSAFEFRALALTSLRSFLMFYLPLLEPRPNAEDDDDDFLQEAPEERHVDLVVPFKKSVKQLARETTVVTTRRVLERLAVIYVSQRMAWKLLKDVPKSAIRKAQRGMPTLVYFWRVTRTTFRGQFLACAASWTVQVGIDTYRCLKSIFGSSGEIDEVDPTEQARVLGKRVFGTTVKCSASLFFASVGAGIGATLLRPSLGQWVGCLAGDFAGPVIVTVCFERFLHTDL